MRHAAAFALLGALVLLAPACGDDSGVTGGQDTSPIDTSTGDTEPADTAGPDTATPDTAAPDTAPDDTAAPDTAVPDTAEPDAAPADTDEDTEPDGACRPDECEIDGACYANQEGAPDDSCLACFVLADRFAWSPLDGAPCDDGTACTTDDTCIDGACAGLPVSCGDGNPCTTDACDPATGACSSTPSDGPCDDGDPCTPDDTCQAGVCVAAGKLDCDDGNGCTNDACIPGKGCIHQGIDGGSCDDGSVCTTGDACVDGACVGTAVDCDDDDLCTVDWCDPAGGCQFESIAALCADENPCTDETCDPKQGCIYPFNTAPCDDKNLCTQDDTCTSGACLGAPIPVDDGNVCTDDGCDPLVGPVYVFNADPCDDLDACTVGDKCAGGACQPGPTPLACDDGNLCTSDSCDPASGCVFAPNTFGCDDASVCTFNDTCSNGECVGTEVSCDDSNACTADTCDAVEGCANDLIVSNACRPTITVTFPPRGATLTGGSGQLLFITGTVTSGAGPITNLTLNGAKQLVQPNGSFSAPFLPRVGGNILALEATDSFGSTRRRVQSFHFAPGYHKPVKTVPKSGMVDPGVGIWLGKDVIDDGVHTLPPDDLATIFEVVLQGFDIAGEVAYGPGSGKPPLASQLGFDIYLTSLTDKKRTVSLAPTFEGLDLNAAVTGVSGKILADGFINLTGTVSISAITISAEVSLDVVDHALVAELTNVVVDVTGLSIDISNDLGILDFILSFFYGTFTDLIKDAFNDQLVGTLEPLLADALTSLAFATEFDMPSLDPSGGSVPVSLETDFSAISTRPEGIQLNLRAGVYAPKVAPYDIKGATARLGCGSGLVFFTAKKLNPLELMLPDDTMNALLYSAWLGGLLEFDVPPSLLSGVDLTQYGITDLDISVSGWLPPTVSDCEADQALRVHIGDLMVTASLTLLGQKMDVVMFVSLKAGFELSVVQGDAGAELGFGLTAIETLESEINVQQEALIGSEGVIGDLIEAELVPQLLSFLDGGAIGGFPLPEIDLGGSVDGVPAGTVIAIDPKVILHESGNTIVSGDLK